MLIGALLFLLGSLLALLGWLGKEEHGASVSAWDDLRCGIWTESEEAEEIAAQDLIRDTARLLRRAP